MQNTTPSGVLLITILYIVGLSRLKKIYTAPLYAWRQANTCLQTLLFSGFKNFRLFIPEKILKKYFKKRNNLSKIIKIIFCVLSLFVISGRHLMGHDKTEPIRVANRFESILLIKFLDNYFGIEHLTKIYFFESWKRK